MHSFELLRSTMYLVAYFLEIRSIYLSPFFYSLRTNRCQPCQLERSKSSSSHFDTYVHTFKSKSSAALNRTYLYPQPIGTSLLQPFVTQDYNPRSTVIIVLSFFSPISRYTRRSPQDVSRYRAIRYTKKNHTDRIRGVSPEFSPLVTAEH